MKSAIQFSAACLVWLFVLAACQEAPAKVPQHDFLLDKKLPLATKIKRLLTEGHPELPLDKKQRQQLDSLYRQFAYRSVFNSDEKGQAIEQQWIQTIAKHGHFGLPLARMMAIEHPSDLIKELLVNYQIGTMVHDLDSGLIDFDRQAFKVKKWKKFPTAWLTESQNTDSLLLSCGPADTNYRYFAQHLYHFADTAVLDTLQFKVCTEKENPSLSWKQAQSALQSLGFIDATADSLSIRKALRTFQKSKGLNPDGRIGTATSIVFGTSKIEQLYSAQISLDRLRQAGARPKTFVAINLPAFELQFVSNDTLRAVHRIIIGKIEHPTPTLQSFITQIVSLPYWRVPSSIAKKEILPALKRSSTYLGKEHMRIYAAGKKEIDPGNVRWKQIKTNTFPYQIIQDPGPWNSLGLIKFEFANSFSVYVHDTPSRQLFNQVFRSFSHGCMRAENPVELGKMILNQDKAGNSFNPINGDSLQVLIDQNVHQKIRLRKAIPIMVTYQTVSADRNGLRFHIDLYQKERHLLTLFHSGNNG